MLILNWNINSIKVRLGHLERVVKDLSPDIILLQETKCLEANFPYLECEDLGYNVKTAGQKSYNGVAILSKTPLEDVIYSIPTYGEDELLQEARYIEACTQVNNQYIRIASVYVPNGQAVGTPVFEYKLKFFSALRKHLQKLRDNEEVFAIGGDFNVAPEHIDVYNPKYLNGKVCFHIDERNNFRAILNDGYYDSFRTMHPDTQQFSWWDYRSNGWKYQRGMRIDHILLSPQATDILEVADVYEQTRGWERPSDHAPLLCRLKSKV